MSVAENLLFFFFHIKMSVLGGQTEKCLGAPQTLRNRGGSGEGQSGPGNSRSAPPPSLALGPWETVFFDQNYQI